jgi:hypothetical protein
VTHREGALDLADLRGLALPRRTSRSPSRAAPTCVGGSMLARRIPSLLPPLEAPRRAAWLPEGTLQAPPDPAIVAHGPVERVRRKTQFAVGGHAWLLHGLSSKVGARSVAE